MYQGLLIAMQTLGLQNMQFLDMGAGGGPPDRTRRVYHRTDELLIQQNVDVPLSAILCLTAIAGLLNRHLQSKSDRCLR